jgi:hypothetical protein
VRVDIGEKPVDRVGGEEGGCSLQGYLAHKKLPPPLGPYTRHMPRALWWS